MIFPMIMFVLSLAIAVWVVYVLIKMYTVSDSIDKNDKLSTIFEEDYDDFEDDRISISLIIEEDGKISAMI